MTITVIFLFIAGLAFLILGADLLVRGATRLAFAFGISPLIVGLTVVAFGTSAPELAVSVQSAFNNQADIALGNVIGSNILNILLILGLSAIVVPLVVDAQLVRLDVPLLIGVSLLVVLFAVDGAIDAWEGVLLLLGAAGYTTFLIRQSRRSQAGASNAEAATSEQPVTPVPAWVNPALIITGLILLVLGARWLVVAAVSMASDLGISELIIGLTIVAGGTSLPEVATSIIAALRGQRDIAVGNVVGSNLFNLLVVLGATAALAPAGILVPPGVMAFDLPIMTVVAVACLPIFFTGYRIDRWEGIVFLAYYVAYVVYLVLQGAHSDGLDAFRFMLLYFAAPLTVLTLAVTVLREMRARRQMNQRMPPD